jgi:hypothetical protein
MKHHYDFQNYTVQGMVYVVRCSVCGHRLVMPSGFAVNDPRVIARVTEGCPDPHYQTTIKPRYRYAMN